MFINNKCIGCTACVETCPVDAIKPVKGYQYQIDKDKCIECGSCKDVCDNGAIDE